ncbi:MAG: hypothetical protein HOP17_16775 [Acidobacteria bacterium]|nr:hypothetical protein [Acidobacteriota bacterium]
MKGKLILAILTAVLSTASGVFAQGAIVLYDPLAKLPETNHLPADEELIKEQVVPKAAEKWKDDDSCSGGNLNIIGALDGAFTKAGARQRAIVYELCQTGNGFANNGVVVVENGRIIASFVEDGGWNLEVSKVADLNKNGRDEIIIETGGGMHQGYYGSSITIVELSATAAVEIGVYLVNTNECENPVANKYCDRSYKITATPGAKPAFFAQKFLNRGTEEKPRWVVGGKALAAKPIADTQNKYTVLK